MKACVSLIIKFPDFSLMLSGNLKRKWNARQKRTLIWIIYNNSDNDNDDDADDNGDDDDDDDDDSNQN